jgi:hypothetical protein
MGKKESEATLVLKRWVEFTGTVENMLKRRRDRGSAAHAPRKSVQTSTKTNSRSVIARCLFE